MKKLLTGVLYAFVWSLLIYLSVSFTNFDFNPQNWSEVSRAIMAIGGFILGALGSLANYMGSKD